ncbi:hypothetical protein FBU30_001948 [Linnemannia zychae]|nr:hypothetical protein FBU30_001948 [Linnemannia zychae]
MRPLPSWKTTAFCLVATLASVTKAAITCTSPNTAGQVFKAGDAMVLSVLSDGQVPKVQDLKTLTATLNCNVGNQISQVKIPAPFGNPFNYTVPSVGNVTTAGGTDGPCVGNKFHITYTGTYPNPAFPLLDKDIDPVACADIIITPEPFYIPPTVSPNVTVAPSTIPSTSSVPKTTTKTSSTSTTAAPSSSQTPEQKDSSGKLSTTVIAIVAIAAVVILAVMAVGIVFHLKRQKRRRMENAIMPWSTQPNNNQFSKVSSMDDGGRSPGSNKPQPPIPAASNNGGGAGYYDDDSYGNAGYSHQQNHHGGYYNDQDAYNQQQDDYYNPYYAQQHSNGGGGYQNAGAAAGGYGYNARGNDMQSYYTGSQGGRTPYQESGDPYNQYSSPSSSGVAGGAGYYPPPPTSGASSAMSPPITSSSQMNSAPNELSSTTLTTGSVSGRAPQVILSEMQSSDEKGGIPMKELSSNSH